MQERHYQHRDESKLMGNIETREGTDGHTIYSMKMGNHTRKPPAAVRN